MSQTTNPPAIIVGMILAKGVALEKVKGPLSNSPVMIAERISALKGPALGALIASHA